jgi:23S rRNA pseudouridine1911/1915/1917 synthase
VLQQKFPDTAPSAFRGWLKQERIANGHFLATSLTQEVDPESLRVLPKWTSLESDVKQLYKDRDIVVVEKPAGLLSVSTEKEKERTLLGVLKRAFRKKVYPVHRLDKETSGVMVFALHKNAQQQWKELFSHHQIERHYMAVLEGSLLEEEGRWESYLYEDASYFVHETQDTKKGKKAITHFAVIGRGKHCTLVDLRLETGRKNQIRVQAAARGFPVRGDRKYGKGKSTEKRLCLHAYSLGFVHPHSKKKMRFSIAVPSFFGSLVRKRSLK